MAIFIEVPLKIFIKVHLNSTINQEFDIFNSIKYKLHNPQKKP